MRTEMRIMMKKISDRKRIVIKVGTSTLTHRTGMLNIRRVEQLVKTLADLQNSGHEVILVSSGAIGLGMGKLGLRERPKDTPGKQACAARPVSANLCISMIIFLPNTVFQSHRCFLRNMSCLRIEEKM